MDITTNAAQDSYDLTLSGKFTFSDTPQFRGVLQQMAEQAAPRVVLHLEHLDFVDSAALGMLLLARDQAEKHQKSLILQGAAGQVKKMFDIACFNTLFTMG